MNKQTFVNENIKTRLTADRIKVDVSASVWSDLVQSGLILCNPARTSYLMRSSPFWFEQFSMVFSDFMRSSPVQFSPIRSDLLRSGPIHSHLIQSYVIQSILI